jgi:putative transposase
MRQFKSPGRARRFLSVHSLIQNLFRIGRHLLRAVNYRLVRTRSFSAWNAIAGV